MFEGDKRIANGNKQLKNLDKTVRPSGRVKSRVQKESLMLAFIYGEPEEE